MIQLKVGSEILLGFTQSLHGDQITLGIMRHFVTEWLQTEPDTGAIHQRQVEASDIVASDNVCLFIGLEESLHALALLLLMLLQELEGCSSQN